MQFPLAEITHDDGRVWIPDLLAWCWQALHGNGLWRLAHAELRAGDRQILGGHGMRWRDLARADGGWAPPELMDEVRECHELPDKSRRATRLLRLLVALDRAGDGIGFARGGFNPSIEPILEHWRSKGGRLTRRSPIVVLRKAAGGFAGGASLAHYLDNYLVCETGEFEVLVHPLRREHSFGNLPRGALRVAFVPLLREKADASFVVGRRDDRFLVELNETAQKKWSSSICELIEKLESNQVNVALFPEACACEDLTDALSNALADNARRRPRTQIALKLVIVGIGRSNPPLPGERMYNDVCVLTGDGRIVCRQTKVHPWCLEPIQRARYRIQSDWEEEDIDLECPAVLHLIEDDWLGRLTILICEDLARPEVARGIAVNIGPSLVVGPVMDDSLEDRCWSHIAAQQLAINEPKSMVLIVNSCWLTNVAGELSRQHRAKSSAPGIGIVCDKNGERFVRLEAGAQFEIRDLDVATNLDSFRRL